MKIKYDKLYEFSENVWNYKTSLWVNILKKN